MSIAVKICGLKSTAAIDAALDAHAVYGGLVFHPRSPRFVGLDEAKALAGRMRSRLKIVALVTDLDDAAIQTLANAIAPDFFQLHGQETVQRTAQIRAACGIPVIKVLPVSEPGDLDSATEFENVADMLMFDAKPPKGAAHPGGHGTAFDWKLLQGRRFRRPWFLAGGLDPDNVARAIELSGAKQVDVSSGVESAPGIKDPARIKAFMDAAQNSVPMKKQSA